MTRNALFGTNVVGGAGVAAVTVVVARAVEGAAVEAAADLVVVVTSVVVVTAVGSVVLISEDLMSLATVVGRPVTAMPASSAITAIAATRRADFTAAAG